MKSHQSRFLYSAMFSLLGALISLFLGQCVVKYYLATIMYLPIMFTWGAGASLLEPLASMVILACVFAGFIGGLISGRYLSLRNSGRHPYGILAICAIAVAAAIFLQVCTFTFQVPETSIDDVLIGGNSADLDRGLHAQRRTPVDSKELDKLERTSKG